MFIIFLSLFMVFKKNLQNINVDSIREKILNKTKKSERLFKKLSTREIEVLRYFSEGRKNKEVAKILGLDEKTISTYKLRLLQKLSVTNLLDLINKAKQLEII